MFESILEFFQNTQREFRDMERLFAQDDNSMRKLVFYSERDIFYRYYEGYIESILASSDLDICYISSDPHDPIFRTDNKRIKPFYIRNLLSAVFSRLDCKALIMTAPDLNSGSIKRAPSPVHHVYVFHAISSIHQAYRLGAFDHYDTVFCVGPYQVDELRKTEELYSLKKKNLLLTGYPLLEKIYEEHQSRKSTSRSERALCLIAPTWGPSSIMEHCLDGLIDALAGSDLNVWIRPHPEFVKREPRRLQAIESRIAKCDNIKLQLSLGTFELLHQADVLVTEHSGISMEYALGTERPVIFIETPLRVDNPEWAKLDMVPVENACRSQLGVCVQLSEVSRIADIIKAAQAKTDDYRKLMPALRDKLVSNWQNSSPFGANYIIDLCKS
jgi:YidC/Oxa1 family membrane protein insertase